MSICGLRQSKKWHPPFSAFHVQKYRSLAIESYFSVGLKFLVRCLNKCFEEGICSRSCYRNIDVLNCSNSFYAVTSCRTALEGNMTALSLLSMDITV